MTFSSLGLAPSLLNAVAEMGYDQPTAIQSAAIPPALRGADVLGQAHTGSGKTAAFGLPLLHALQAPRAAGPRRLHGLVLVPTRELAAQVGEALRALARYLPQPVKVALAFGGVSINPQMMALRGGTDIMVATPGRLLDLVEHNAIQLDSTAVLVLDEADKLLDMGFADEIARIMALLPARRQNLFFSATFPSAVQALAGQLLRDPVRVAAPDEASAPDIAQRAIEVDSARRTPLLRQLLRDEGWRQVLVFVATKYASEHVADKLRRNGVAAEAFHGDFSQGARSAVLNDFRQGKLQVLVATDVAARGIDIAQLPVVVNYDLPRSPADYTHRIGRTGRAGASGLAVSFITAEAEQHFRLIEKRQGLRVAREQVAGFAPTTAAPVLPPGAADGTGGIKGKRKSKKDKLREAAAAAAKQ